MRYSLQFLLVTAISMAAFVMMPLHAGLMQRHAVIESEQQRQQFRRLQITDLCLATEARYTRHSALADHHAPFQEHPVALEHFPSGSLILPMIARRVTP